MNFRFPPLRQGFKMLTGDRPLFLLSLIPLALGLLLYFSFGLFLYGDLFDWIWSFLDARISSPIWGSVGQQLLKIGLGILLYFFVSWGFILVVSLLACPFNDMISARVEDIVRGKENLPSTSFSSSFKKFPRILVNEIKKVILILFLSCLGLLISLVPLLTPLGLFLTAILLAIGFIDYSWSRHEYPLSKCLKDLAINFWPYTLGGLFFCLIVSVPFLGLFVPSLGTVYFTLVFAEGQKP